MKITVQVGTKPKVRRGGPRVLKPGTQLRAHEVCNLDQDSIQHPEVKDLGRIARSSRSPQHWITYCRALRNARVEWREAKLEMARQDWNAYHWAKRRSTTRWQEGFAAAQDIHPAESIQNHFRGIFAAGGDAVDEQLAELQKGMGDDFREFSEREIRDAVFAGSNKKAVESHRNFSRRSCKWKKEPRR